MAQTGSLVRAASGLSVQVKMKIASMSIMIRGIKGLYKICLRNDNRNQAGDTMHERQLYQISREILELLDLRDIDFNSVIYKGPFVNHQLAFPMDEIISAVHGTLGLLIARISEMRTAIKQGVSVDIVHAYLSPMAVFLVRLNGYPVYPWDPVYPTVGLYQTQDKHYIFMNGGHPRLRDRILKVLDQPNDQDRIRKAVLNWKAEALETALAEADVFVEGWRPGVMAKYGLLPEDVQKIRPGIIHLSLNCYGEEGPFAKRAGWEQLGQAVSATTVPANFCMTFGMKSAFREILAA